MKNFKRYNSLTASFWYKNNSGKYGHNFREVQIGHTWIFLTDGFNIIRTVYYKPKTSIRTLKVIANMLLIDANTFMNQGV